VQTAQKYTVSSSPPLQLPIFQEVLAALELRSASTTCMRIYLSSKTQCSHVASEADMAVDKSTHICWFGLCHVGLHACFFVLDLAVVSCFVTICAREWKQKIQAGKDRRHFHTHSRQTTTCHAVCKRKINLFMLNICSQFSSQCKMTCSRAASTLCRHNLQQSYQLFFHTFRQGPLDLG